MPIFNSVSRMRRKWRSNKRGIVLTASWLWYLPIFFLGVNYVRDAAVDIIVENREGQLETAAVSLGEQVEVVLQDIAAKAIQPASCLNPVDVDKFADCYRVAPPNTAPLFFWQPHLTNGVAPISTEISPHPVVTTEALESPILFCFLQQGGGAGSGNIESLACLSWLPPLEEWGALTRPAGWDENDPTATYDGADQIADEWMNRVTTQNINNDFRVLGATDFWVPPFTRTENGRFDASGSLLFTWYDVAADHDPITPYFELEPSTSLRVEGIAGVRVWAYNGRGVPGLPLGDLNRADTGAGDSTVCSPAQTVNGVPPFYDDEIGRGNPLSGNSVSSRHFHRCAPVIGSQQIRGYGGSLSGDAGFFPFTIYHYSWGLGQERALNRVTVSVCPTSSRDLLNGRDGYREGRGDCLDALATATSPNELSLVGNNYDLRF